MHFDYQSLQLQGIKDLHDRVLGVMAQFNVPAIRNKGQALSHAFVQALSSVGTTLRKPDGVRSKVVNCTRRTRACVTTRRVMKLVGLTYLTMLVRNEDPVGQWQRRQAMADCVSPHHHLYDGPCTNVLTGYWDCKENGGSWVFSVNVCLPKQELVMRQAACKSQGSTWLEYNGECVTREQWNSRKEQDCLSNGGFFKYVWGDVACFVGQELIDKAAHDCYHPGLLWSFYKGFCNFVFKTQEDCERHSGMWHPVAGCRNSKDYDEAVCTASGGIYSLSSLTCYVGRELLEAAETDCHSPYPIEGIEGFCRFVTDPESCVVYGGVWVKGSGCQPLRDFEKAQGSCHQQGGKLNDEWDCEVPSKFTTCTALLQWPWLAEACKSPQPDWTEIFGTTNGGAAKKTFHQLMVALHSDKNDEQGCVPYAVCVSEVYNRVFRGK